MELSQIPRGLYDRACAKAVRVARIALADGRYDPRQQPLHLIATSLFNPQLPQFPQDVTSASRADYINQTVSIVRDGLLGEHAPAGTDDVVLELGLSLRQIAPLKIATVYVNNGLDLRLVVSGDQAEAGDTGSFGGVQVLWVDHDGQEHTLNIAGTGWHPVADRTAALLFPAMLDLQLAEEQIWIPQVVDSDNFLLTQDGLPLKPALHSSNFCPNLRKRPS